MSWLTLDLQQWGLWDRFRVGAVRASDSVAQAVTTRWQRVRALGVDPEAICEPIDGNGALLERRDRLDPLLALLPELLDPAISAFAERDFTLLLADADGVVVEQRGGGRFADEARRVKLIAGSHWSEATRGTNAIGTALAERRPVAVHGKAHWAKPNHGLVCYAAPIHDARGELVAILDATSFLERADLFAQIAVEATARAIEGRLHATSYATSRHNSALRELLDACAEPALIIDRMGHVRRANARARCWLEEALPWTWQELEVAAASESARLPVRSARGATLGACRVEPLLDASGAMIAAVVIGASLDAPHQHAMPRAASPALVAKPDTHPAFDALHGDDLSLGETRRLASRLARTALPILLLAETGTGKELLARAIHAASPRAAKPFVAINCGALTEALLDSELFGYGPGAFTGALKEGREGLLAAASGGTLFLDEVAEMPAGLQARLLRFLESGAYHRVSEVEERRADVRLICATCRDLPALVSRGEFRADLYYRVRGATLSLPPLRERADRARLADALLDAIAQEMALEICPRLSSEALRAMERWEWPGNIRELKNALRVALALCDGDVIFLEHLPDELSVHHGVLAAPTAAAPTPHTGRAEALEEVEVMAITRALRIAQGNVSEAARRLGVARSTLYRMMDRHALR